MISEPPPAAIIFDLDNTLFRYGPRYRDYYALTAATAAINLGLDRDLQALVEFLKRSGAADDDDVARFATTHGLPEKALVHEFNAVAGRMFSGLTADPGYAEALPGLPGLLARTKLPMAVMTHGPHAWAQPVLAHLGLSDIFGNMVFPADHAPILGKRSPAGFLTVARLLGAPPERIAVVDDIADNFLLAAPLGMRTILVNWGKPLPALPPHIHRQVTDVRDFLQEMVGP